MHTNNTTRGIFLISLHLFQAQLGVSMSNAEIIDIYQTHYSCLITRQQYSINEKIAVQ